MKNESPCRPVMAANVEHGSEDLACAGGSGFVTRGSEDLMKQLRIPCAGEAERLGKTCAAVFHEPMKCLSHEQRRDTKPRLLVKKALDSVAENGSLARGKGLVRVPPAAQHGARGLGRIGAGWVNDFGPGFPSSGDLMDFFLQSHAGKQVG